jgi:hypothetical protein
MRYAWMVAALSALGLVHAPVGAAPDAANMPWSVWLAARVGQCEDSGNRLGESRVTRAFVDPPTAPTAEASHVKLTFAYGGSMDIRAFGRAAATWEFTVETDVPDADVVVAWGGTAAVPRKVNLTLEDATTGARVWMRTASHYTFRSGQGTTQRKFVVTADSAPRAALRITGSVARGGRAGVCTLAFTLSRAASTRVVIQAAAGRVVRSLEPARSRAAGPQQVVWDGKDSAGKALPAGAYLFEITASTDESEQARAAVPFVLAR